MATLVQTLPWLPRPSEPDRQRLKALSAAAGLEGLSEARGLAGFGWDEPNLRALGRHVRRLIAGLGEASPAAVADAGFTPLRVVVLAPVTVSHMVDALIATAIRFGFLLELQVAEYEAPQSWLDRHRSALAAHRPNFVLVADDPRMAPLTSPLGDQVAADDVVEAAVRRMVGVANYAREAAGCPVVIQTLAADPDMPQINLDRGLAGSPRQLLGEFNRRLAIAAQGHAHLLLDVAAMADLVGQATWSSDRYWYVAKYPFAVEMAPLWADHLMRLLAAQMGRSRRVLVLDLDNTLWGGVVGDDGLGGLELGPGSPMGEAYCAIQRMALAYRDRGVILCVASKNEEANALEVFRRHPEMVIKEDDIVVFRINWQDKAANIRAIAEMLDLGLESFVFLDDNPAERKRVRDALPMVAAPELPASPSSWIAVVQAAGYFEQAGFSDEDRQRSGFYKANLRRAEHMEAVGDHDTFLASLQMSLEMTPFDAAGRKRIVQLIAKSNQFNLTTRRYGAAEVAAMESDPAYITIQARLEDIFGDNGMISTVICRARDRDLEVESWIMSCRVLGRRVEEAILGRLVDQARQAGLQRIIGRYAPTSKNALVQDHYANLGFERIATHPDGSSDWRLMVADFAEKPLPFAVKAAMATQ